MHVVAFGAIVRMDKQNMNLFYVFHVIYARILPPEPRLVALTLTLTKRSTEGLVASLRFDTVRESDRPIFFQN